jgi:hypothetical protein
MFGVDQMNGHLARRRETTMTDVTQGELIPAPARVNKYGSPCPPWCAIDHGRAVGTNGDGQPVVISTHISAGQGGANAVAVQGGSPWFDGKPAVQLRMNGILANVAPAEALAVADILDAIADGKITRDECRLVAAQVRARALIIAAEEAR